MAPPRNSIFAVRLALLHIPFRASLALARAVLWVLSYSLLDCIRCFVQSSRALATVVSLLLMLMTSTSWLPPTWLLRSFRFS